MQGLLQAALCCPPSEADLFRRQDFSPHGAQACRLGGLLQRGCSNRIGARLLAPQSRVIRGLCTFRKQCLQGCGSPSSAARPCISGTACVGKRAQRGCPPAGTAAGCEGVRSTVTAAAAEGGWQNMLGAARTANLWCTAVFSSRHAAAQFSQL